jgi:hypothetical protein
MTWYGIVGIIVMSILLGFLSVWLDEHLKIDATCPKCGHVQGEDKK